MLHFVYTMQTPQHCWKVYHESACMGIPAIHLLYLLIAVYLTSALEIQALALLQLYAVFYAVLSLSISGYIPAPESVSYTHLEGCGCLLPNNQYAERNKKAARPCLSAAAVSSLSVFFFLLRFSLHLYIYTISIKSSSLFSI